MRKFIILGLIAATAMPTAVMAQSRSEVRDSARDLRQEQRDLRDARRYGDRRDVREPVSYTHLTLPTNREV